MNAAVLTEAQWIGKVLQTRTHGSCYIPVASRHGMVIEGIMYAWRPYGRSAEGGGNKHKAYAHDSSGNSVLSKNLKVHQVGNF